MACGDHDLRGVDAVVLPGGFSYGDYLRALDHHRFHRLFSGNLQKRTQFSNGLDLRRVDAGQGFSRGRPFVGGARASAISTLAA